VPRAFREVGLFWRGRREGLGGNVRLKPPACQDILMLFIDEIPSTLEKTERRKIYLVTRLRLQMVR
jgi:hypothetical protein